MHILCDMSQTMDTFLNICLSVIGILLLKGTCTHPCQQWKSVPEDAMSLFLGLFYVLITICPVSIIIYLLHIAYSYFKTALRF